MLSENATKLLAFLQKNGGAWKDNCIDHVFNKPVYASNPDAQRNYWQWEADAYGGNQSRPVAGESVIFSPLISRTFSTLTSDAYQELKTAGLANERNNGYNEYWLYATVQP